MPKRLYSAAALDETDRALLSALAEDSRMAVSELARQVGLSAPSTAERLRRLETQGVIERYTVQIDPRALGYTLQAIVRVKPLPGQLHLVEEVLRRIPEFVECDKVTGDDCFVCRLVLRSIEQLDEILSKVTERAETSTAIVKSTPVPRRLPPLAPPELEEEARPAAAGAKTASAAAASAAAPSPAARSRTKR
ncbi:Lrp/AsnC family transcriptional regulator [Trinickia terrae]|uniref:Lrp/AsnC family transcriptional regulator n=1 Tax=Trinickia terrae TaxID=2571161 RepID=A0A4U1I831_9BURK|nr:Lrp/AsnC family transcriptional regulator [Trinickia terrae]